MKKVIRLGPGDKVHMTARFNEILDTRPDLLEDVQGGFIDYVAELTNLPSMGAAWKQVADFIEGASKRLWAESEVKPVCKKGCSMCCYQSVGVSDYEAEKLIPYVTPDKIEHLQKQFHKKRENWGYAPENRCIFLQDDGACGVYENRPLVCRITFGTEPEKCSTSSPQKLPTSIGSEIAVSAFWTIDGKVDSMPRKLLKFLDPGVRLGGLK